MASCLRCIKFGIGGRLAGNSSSRIIVGVSEAASLPRTSTQCVRNSAALSVGQTNAEIDFSNPFHPGSFGSVLDQQQQLVDLTASSIYGESETYKKYLERQDKKEILTEEHAVEPTPVVDGNFHCFDPLGLILCPSVHCPEDIQISGTEGAHSNGHSSNIRTFRLPANAVWYPRGTHHQGADMVCSLRYSELENEVIEKFTNAANDKTETLVSVTENSSRETGLLESSAYDLTMFMKDAMSLEKEGSQMQCSAVSPPNPNKLDPSGKPSMDQLDHVYEILSNNLPNLFYETMNYRIYSQNVVFENRIRGKVTVGLIPYVKQIVLLRTIGHLKFAHISFDILKITKHPEDGTIRVRWQIRGMSGLKAFIQFWKIKVWSWKGTEQQMVNWYDGFSTFYVGGDGLVHKHVADSMMPDEEQNVVEKGPLATKVAALLGLVHRPNLGDASSPFPVDLGALSVMLKEDEEVCSNLMLPLERIQ